MPNRIIRAGINRSERVNQLDAAEEVFYRRLLNEIDDHGLFDARPSILRATLFPLRLDKVREADIFRWMAACQKADLIVLYAVNEASGSRRFLAGNTAGPAALDQGEKPYLKVLDTRWKARSEPKFPLPPPFDNNCTQLQTTDIKCSQSLAIAPLDVVVDGDVVVVGSGNSPPFDNFTDPLANMAQAVSAAIGKPAVPEGAAAAPIHEAAAEFVAAGCAPADVSDYEADYYRRKTQSGSNYPLTLKILREDLPGWVRARRMRANGAGQASEPQRPPVVSAPPEYRKPKREANERSDV